MDRILVDLSQAALVAANEANLGKLLGTLGAWPRIEVHTEVHQSWSISDLPFFRYNSLWGARLAEAERSRNWSKSL